MLDDPKGREPCISDRAKRSDRFTYYNGILLLRQKTADATILNSNKTAKTAFYNLQKRYDRNVRFIPKELCSASGHI